MNLLFVDPYYFFAILNPRDAAHTRAVEFSAAHSNPLVTTTWVLTEVADGLARSASRSVFGRLTSRFRSAPGNRIIPASDDLFEKGVALYDARRDRQWSLTDCVSFVVMTESGIQDALTGDHHFEQAGFRALLK